MIKAFYVARASVGEVQVNVWYEERKTDRLDLYYPECSHSPDGFEFGYAGSGPAQLAYAILREWSKVNLKLSEEESKKFTQERYQRFKDDFIAPKSECEAFSVHAVDIENWCKGVK